MASQVCRCMLSRPARLRDHPKSYMWDKKRKCILFYIKTPPPPPPMKEVWSLIPHIRMHPSHLYVSFLIYIHNGQFQILSWGMILPQKLISHTWVWDNVTEMYEMGSQILSLLQPISFSIPHATCGWYLRLSLRHLFLTPILSITIYVEDYCECQWTMYSVFFKFMPRMSSGKLIGCWVQY